MFHGRMLADPVFIIVDHDEVVGQAGPGDSDIYSAAVGHVNANQVII
jgi:hypothetical protein